MTQIQIYTSQLCPYCQRARRLLERKEVTYEEIRVDLVELDMDGELDTLLGLD